VLVKGDATAASPQVSGWGSTRKEVTRVLARPITISQAETGCWLISAPMPVSVKQRPIGTSAYTSQMNILMARIEMGTISPDSMLDLA
jgi:hypothetical protein